MDLYIKKAEVVTTDFMDLVLLHTLLPQPFAVERENTPTLILEIKVPKGKGHDYLHNNFPSKNK